MTLSYSGRKVGGFLAAECDRSEVMGTLTDAVIEVVVPEPATLALPALAGLIVGRRRL